MLPCDGCAYRQGVPGSAHIRCVFKWHPDTLRAAIPAPSPRVAQWFFFPLNYDPVWGPDVCPNRNETRDPAQTMPDDPMLDLLSLLGGR